MERLPLSILRIFLTNRITTNKTESRAIKKIDYLSWPLFPHWFSRLSSSPVRVPTGGNSKGGVKSRCYSCLLSWNGLLLISQSIVKESYQPLADSKGWSLLQQSREKKKPHGVESGVLLGIWNLIEKKAGYHWTD